jgi:murein DD-endopeptidase MepM/ murein hydrolase activator NlpD
MASPLNNIGESSNPGGKKLTTAMSSAESASDKMLKNFMGIEKIINNSISKLGKMMGTSGSGGAGGVGGTGGSMGPEFDTVMGKLDNMFGKSGSAGGTALRVGLGVASAAYGMAPNTTDAVAQRMSAQAVGSMAGLSAQSIIQSSNAMVGGGITGAYSAQGATSMLAGGGILPTMGSYKNIMGQVGGYSVLTGMSNEQVAGGMASINGMNFLRVGINARDKEGNLRDPSAIANDLYRRMYGGRSVTAEQAAQVFNPSSRAYKSVMAAAGGNQELFQSLATNLVYQAKNGGKALDMSDPEKVKNDILKLPKDDPMRAMYNYQQSEANKLEATGSALVGGFSTAANATAAVNNGFASLATTLGPVADGFFKLKGILDSLPMLGNTGGTLSGLAGSGIGSIADAIQGRATENMLDGLMGTKGGAGGGGGTKGSFKGGLKAGKGLGAGLLLSGAGIAMGMGTDWIKNKEAGKHSKTTNQVGLAAARAGQYALTGASIGLMTGPAAPVAAPVLATLGALYGGWKGWQEGSQDPNTGGDTSASASVSAISQPTGGSITADYGQKPKNNSYWQWKGYHTGRDFGVKSGTPVKAVRDGTVVGAGNVAGEAYGNTVIVDHGGYQSFYAHLSAINVKKGDTVKRGSQIALSGQSGSGAKMGAHLHFEIRKGKNNPVDPRPYLAGATSGGTSIAGAVGNAVSGAVNKIKGFFQNEDDEESTESGFSQASGPSVVGSSNFSGFTGNKDMTTTSLLRSSGVGGDAGAGSIGSSSSSSSNSGGGITINMNIKIASASTADAARLAKDVKKILEKDLQTNKIISY